MRRTHGSHRLLRRLVPRLPRSQTLPRSTPGAIDEVVKRTGKRAIPQFVIDGEWVQPYDPGKGFLYEKMAKRLGIKTP